MLSTIIKNNFKLMFRNKMMLILMLLSPILIIAALSSAFHGLLSSYESVDFSVGYYIEEDSPIHGNEDVLLEAFEEQDIQVQQYQQNLMESAIQDGEVDIFLYCGKEECQIGTKDAKSIEAKSVVYSMEQFAREYQLAVTDGMRMAMGESPTERVSIKKEALPYTKMADAESYYGMIEIIFFLCLGGIFLTAVIQSERKNRIQQRFMISPTSRLNLYLGKFIPCELMMLFSLGVSALVATLLFDIQWGNIPGTIGILLLVSVAMNAFGIMAMYLFNNLAISITFYYGFMTALGFPGGCYETYMLSRIPENIKLVSPLYYINRTIVEYSTMGHSDYTKGCILYMVGILVVCTTVGILLINRRMEEKS